MLQSMTGFASKTFTITKEPATSVYVTASVKALNSRFFEVSCKLPYALSHIETAIIKKIKKQLIRGHIFVTVHMSNPNALSGSVEAAINTVGNYVNAINLIKQTFHIDQPLLLDHIVRLPNVFVTQEERLDDQIERQITSIIDDLITQVIVERKQEGTALHKDLESRINQMKQEIARISKRYELVMAEHKDKAHALLQELQHDDTAATESRKSNLYTTLDKIDIHEEIVRFESHLENLMTIITNPSDEKGKRIDFTLQELAREINTITAKCNDYEIGTNAINIKVEIEKAREQTQNIV